jgi:capsule biosynthesis phosphatase
VLPVYNGKSRKNFWSKLTLKKDQKILVIDIDGTIAKLKKSSQEYSELSPENSLVKKITAYKKKGWKIVLFTSRNMKTYQGDMNKILKHTAPILIDWLNKHNVPYDELHFGKPWCGEKGFYIDDRAIRPREFLNLTSVEIQKLLIKDRST